MKKDKFKIKYYGDFLSNEEIVAIGTEIRAFEKARIDFLQLKANLLSKGVEIKAHLRDFATVKMTLKTAQKLKERLAVGNYIPNDLVGYSISSAKYQDVLIRYDRKMMEALAAAGDKEVQETLEYIKDWERRHSFRSSIYTNKGRIK